jgi:hypothetical protein
VIRTRKEVFKDANNFFDEDFVESTSTRRRPSDQGFKFGADFVSNRGSNRGSVHETPDFLKVKQGSFTTLRPGNNKRLPRPTTFTRSEETSEDESNTSKEQKRNKDKMKEADDRRV